MINIEKVENIFKDCMFTNKEYQELKLMKVSDAKDRFIMIEGVAVSKIFLNKQKVEKYKEEISSILDELNPKFKEGWSFLNLCADKNGKQWTNEHKNCEQLLILGLAIDKIEYCSDRGTWWLLPGQMSYVKIK